MGFPQLVMVVDDEHMIEQMIEAHLKKKGYEHVSFHDALAAMEFFRDNYDNIGLAIIDLTMPALNGDEMAARMRVLAPKLPIIIMRATLTFKTPAAMSTYSYQSP